MPFIRESIGELRHRTGLSHYKLAVSIETVGRERELAGKISFTPQTLQNWERSDGPTPNSNSLDALYAYAQSQGFDDLEFFVPPINPDVIL